MKFINFILGFILLFTLSSSTAFAQTTNPQQQVVILPRNTTVNHNYFGAGNTVIISGTVNGDVYAAGGNVLIDGQVNGDVLTAGGNITVRGYVAGNLRAAGGQINVTGTINRDVSAAGGSVMIGDNAKINGSLNSASGDLTLYAPIATDANIAAGQVTIDNTINRDANIAAGQLTLTSRAKIVRNLDYWSNQQINRESGSQVDGKLTYHALPQTPQNQRASAQAALTGAAIFFKVSGIVSILILGLLFLQFLPVYSQKITDTARQHTLLSLGIGALAAITTPVALIVLLLAVFFLPIVLIGFSLFMIIAYLSRIFIALALGQWISNTFSWKIHIMLEFILGLILLEIVTAIPIIGGIISLLSFMIGFGALLIMKKEFYTNLRLKKLI